MKYKSLIISKSLLLVSVLLTLVSADVKSEYQSLFQSLNIELHSGEHVRCGFLNHARLHQLIQQAHPEIQTLSKQNGIFERPSRQDSVLSPDGHFLLYYDTTGNHAVPDADVEGNGIPDYIDSAGVYLDKSWDMEINQLGFYPPPGPDGNPIEIYPIYFTDFRSVYGVTYYGLTTPEEIVSYSDITDFAYTSFMELHNDYEGNSFYSNGLEGLKVTAAHEFNHAIQFGYNSDYFDNIFFMEMTSTWLEDYVFDEVNDYVFYLNTGYNPFFDNIFTISFTSVDGYDPYANCLYVHMLSKQYGSEIIKNMWDRIIHESAFDALNSELVNRNSSFAESQNRYAGWLFFTGSRSLPNLYFSEGSEYPEIELDEGIDAFDDGLVAEGMRLIELTPTINGLTRAKVSGAEEGQFSHIIDHQNLTQPVSFDNHDIVTVNKNESIIVVLSNPNSSPIPNLSYELKRDKIRIEQGPVVINTGSARVEFSNVPENAIIRIFNVLGQKINSLHNTSGNLVQWDLKDHFGNRTPSGTYFYFVKSDGFESAGKLTVLR